MRCPEHERDFIGSCMWCGKQLCKECVAKTEGKKMYCRQCAAKTEVLQKMARPTFPEQGNVSVASDLDQELNIGSRFKKS